LHSLDGLGCERLLRIGYFSKTLVGDGSTDAACSSEDGAYLDKDIECVTPVGDHLTDATDLTFDTLKSADYALGGLVMRLLHDFPPVELGYETGVHGQQTPESGQIFHEH
jgi:hypothetical protein